MVPYVIPTVASVFSVVKRMHVAAIGESKYMSSSLITTALSSLSFLLLGFNLIHVLSFSCPYLCLS